MRALSAPVFVTMLLFSSSRTSAQVLPDLVPVSVEGPRSATRGQTITVGIGVRNAGMANAQGGWGISIFLSKDSLITPQDVVVGGAQYPSTLSAGALGGRSASVTIPSTLDSAMWYVGAILDPGARVAELNENNNALAGAVQIAIPASAALAPALPDLYPLRLKVQPLVGTANLHPGDDAVIEVEVRNLGTAASGAWTGRLALLGNGSTYLIGTTTGANIPAGYPLLHTFRLTIPSSIPAGSYIEFQFDVDPSNLIREIGEPGVDNNRTVRGPVSILSK